MGEGYHNFHHRFPSDFRNGIRWRDYDPTKWLVCALAAVRLASGPEAHVARSDRPRQARAAPTDLTMRHIETVRSLPLSRAMFRRSRQFTVEAILARADVRVGGRRPWDIRVHDERFFARVLADAELGFGESYMDGDWDCDRLDELASRLFAAELDRVAPRPVDLVNALIARIVTRQTRRRVRRDVAPHYDLGNDLFEAMLDTRLHGVHLRLLARRRAYPGGSAGGQARSCVPQADAGAGNAGPRHRLRLGWVCQVRRRALRRRP